MEAQMNTARIVDFSPTYCKRNSNQDGRFLLKNLMENLSLFYAMPRGSMPVSYKNQNVGYIKKDTNSIIYLYNLNHQKIAIIDNVIETMQDKGVEWAGYNIYKIGRDSRPILNQIIGRIESRIWFADTNKGRTQQYRIKLFNCD